MLHPRQPKRPAPTLGPSAATPGPSPGPSAPPRHDAFISYNHAADGSVFAVVDTTPGGPVEAQVVAIACRTLRPGAAVLVVRLVADPADYDRDLGAMLALLPGLGFPNVEAAAHARLSDGPTLVPYTSPSHGYSLRWDAEAWLVEEDSSEAGRHRLQLVSAGGEGRLLVTTSRLAPAASLGACVEEASFQLLAGAANAEPLAGSPSDPAGVAVAYRLVLEGVDARAHVECRPLGPGQPMLLAVYLAPAPEYETRLREVLAMIAGIAPADPTATPAAEVPAAGSGDHTDYRLPSTVYRPPQSGSSQPAIPSP